MAQTIDPNDPWRALTSIIDFRCGKCGLGVKPAFEVKNVIGEPRGILFKCHDDEEFLEVSEASLRIPKRFRGYMPFTNRLSKKEREKLNEDLRRDATKRTATAKKVAAEAERLREAALADMRNNMGRTDVRFLGIRPTCARCGRPVDQMVAYEDMNTRDTIFRFQCHGESEDIPVPRDAVRRGDFPRMLQGYRPFTASAGIDLQIDPRSGRPSEALNGFMQRLLEEVARGTLSRSQAQALISSGALRSSDGVTFTFDPVPIQIPLTPPKPKPKPIEMIVTSKPRKISLED